MGADYGLLLGMGWDWFGLQLNDNREVLISRLHPSDSGSPQEPIAKLIEADGTITTSEHVVLEPLRYWRSLYTGVHYPVEWHITLPDFSIELHIVPLLIQQEIPIIGPMKEIWEGACTLTGVERSSENHMKKLKGEGFVELVGYAK